MAIRIWRAPWSTNCERIALALGHKGLEAESVLIDYSDRTEVERVSGQGLVPVIEEDGEVVNDSLAIMRHLEESHPEPPLFPPEDPALAQLDLFLGWFDGVWKQAPNALEAELGKESPDEATVAELSERIALDLAIFDGMLTGRDYLLGEFGASDCAAFPFLKYAAGRDPADDELFHVILDEHQSLDGRPRLAEWIERVAKRPRAFGQM